MQKMHNMGTVIGIAAIIVLGAVAAAFKPRISRNKYK